MKLDFTDLAGFIEHAVLMAKDHGYTIEDLNDLYKFLEDNHTVYFEFNERK